ncbi:MAG: ATP-binding cassette domain-containing protein [Gammaproteobacteria bacterium]|nr:ATP-binding cassette domain-containing protein [Gammaproteobacteria bacterium]
MSNSSCVVFEQASKSFGDLVALDSLSLAIPSGCIYGFIGPNGAGKTTAMRLLLGIMKPSSGGVQVLGASDGKSARSQIGYLPEEKGLYPRMRVLDFVVYMGRLNRLDKRQATRRARDLLDEFDLKDWQNEKCQSLSKGMGQKVQLISTLVHDPQLMILDEPFSGLDPINTDVVRSMILSRVESNATVILSTHIMEQAETLCSALVLINKGRAVLEGSMDEIRSGDTVYLEHNRDESVLRDLPGVLSVKQFGRGATLRIDPSQDSQDLLRSLMERTNILKFDTTSASLHEIFVREVGRDVQEEEAENA